MIKSSTEKTHFTSAKKQRTINEVGRLFKVVLIREIQYLAWLAIAILLKKVNGK